LHNNAGFNKYFVTNRSTRESIIDLNMWYTSTISKSNFESYHDFDIFVSVFPL